MRGDGVSGQGGAGGQGSPGLPGPATVTVVDPFGVPNANAAVVFYDAEGQSPAIVMTDAYGRATHEIVPNARITVAFKRSSVLSDGRTRVSRQLATFIDAQPDDDLQVLDTTVSEVTPDRTVANVYIDFTPPPVPTCPDTVTCSYTYVNVICGDRSYFSSDEASPLKASVGARCLDPGIKATIVVASDTLIAGVVSTYYKIMNGMTIADGAHYAVDVWSAARTYEVSFSGVPDDLSAVGVHDSFYRAGIELWGGLAGTKDSSATSVQVAMPPSDIDSVVQRIFVAHATESRRCEPTSKRFTYEPLSGPAPFDLSQLLPPMHDFNLVFAADGGVQELSWERVPSLVNTDGTLIMLAYDVSPERKEEEDLHGYWAIVAPSTRSHVSPPPLPNELADLVDPGPYQLYDVSAYQSTDIDGYTGFRHAFGRKFGQLIGNPDLPALEGPNSVVLRAGIACPRSSLPG